MTRYVGWLAASVAASCGYQELPKLTGADAPPQFSSCMGLVETCGVGEKASCCDPAMTVPGGTFRRSYDAVPGDFNDMGYPATVSPFVLDKYEVTVGRFRAFVYAGQGTQASPPAAGAGAHPQLAGSGWDSAWNVNLAANTPVLTSAVKCDATYQMWTWTDTPGANENKPMNCVTWYEAMAFCIWDGGYLPAEAEWNYAASGGSEQRAYPWSNPSTSRTVDCMYANYRIDNPTGMHCVNGTTGAVTRVGSKSPWGDGKWDHSDLAGNVWEWTLDWYVQSYPLPCNNCANLVKASARLIRGGSFDDAASNLHTAIRYSKTPTYRRNDVGLRCARTP